MQLYSYYTIVHTRLHTSIGNACACEHDTAVTLECVHNNNIAVSLAYVVGQMARPGARGLGPAWASNMKLFCGPGLDIIVAGRAWAS